MIELFSIIEVCLVQMEKQKEENKAGSTLIVQALERRSFFE